MSACHFCSYSALPPSSLHSSSTLNGLGRITCTSSIQRLANMRTEVDKYVQIIDSDLDSQGLIRARHFD